MAATNYTPIQLYYSTTASAAPTAGNLVNGELAINITDGKLYYKDNGGVVQVISTKGTGTIGGSTTQVQYNNAGALAGSANFTFNGTTATINTLNLTNALGTAYGGTAQSAYAQGDLLYASAVNTLSKLSIGTVNYILTSTGSVPQWVAPTSVTVQTANNLAGGAAGSVPYQSAADTTTFLAIGAANRVMTSTGSAPQWVTSLTGLTGVSSSSMTNTGLTSGRVVYSGASGVQTDSANLTFNGTTLSAGGFSTTGNSTLVKLVTIGDSGFTTGAVLAAATPAKLYIGTGAVTDGTSAGGATNTLGTITAFGQTQVIATNANVTYTNLATLYVAGAPTAGTNVTITNPYSLYIAGGASYLGGSLLLNTLTASKPVFTDANKNLTSSGTLLTDQGGTGLSSFTAGDLTYYASGTALTKLAIGTNGQILTSTGTAPQWSTLSGVAVTTFSAGTTGFTPSSATSGAVTLAGTLATTNGGTGLTSFTANQVFYASSTSAIAQSANLTFDGSTLTVTGGASVVGTTPVLLQRPVIPSFAGQGAPAIQWQFYSTGTTYTTGAYIQALADAAWSSTSAPTSLRFYTVPSGSTTAIETMRNDASGMFLDTGAGGGRMTFSPGATQNQILSTTTGFAAYNILRHQASQYQWLNASSTQMMTLTSAGDLLVGKTSAALNNTTGTAISGGFITTHSNSGNGTIELGATRAAVAADIGGLVTFRAVYRNSDSDSTTIANIKGFRENATNNNWSSYLAFETTNGSTLAERARIDSSGRLLVGTTSNFGGAGQFAIDQSGGGIPAIHLIGTQGVGGGERETGATFSVVTNDTGPAYGNVAKIAAAKENATQGNTAGYLKFYTTPNGGALTARMLISSTGAVMTGSTGPNNGQSYRLGVYAATQDVQLLINSDNGYNAYINFAGFSGGLSYGRDGGTGYFRWNNAVNLGGTQIMTLTDGGNLSLGTTSTTFLMNLSGSTGSPTGGVSHNGVFRHAYNGSKPASTQVKLRVWMGNYTSGMLTFNYAHTNSGDYGNFIQVWLNNSYGVMYTQVIASKLTSDYGTLTTTTYSPGSGNDGYYEITMPAGNASGGAYSAVIDAVVTSGNSAYFSVV